MFESDSRFREAVSHFGEKVSYQWLGLDGDEWIDQSNRTIDVDFLSDFTDFEEELADVILVAMSTLHHFGSNIDALIKAKMDFNHTRND